MDDTLLLPGHDPAITLSCRHDVLLSADRRRRRLTLGVLGIVAISLYCVDLQNAHAIAGAGSVAMFGNDERLV